MGRGLYIQSNKNVEEKECLLWGAFTEININSTSFPWLYGPSFGILLSHVSNSCWPWLLFFRKMHQFETAILLYQSSLECKIFVKLKETQLLYFVIKQTKPFPFQRLVRDEKLRELLVSSFFKQFLCLI